MATTSHKMIWLQYFVQDLGITTSMHVPMHCDNQATTFIVGNIAFHNRTKHIEINCCFIHDRVLIGVISTPHVASSYHLTDIFTKSIIGMSSNCLGSKLGM